VSTPAKKCKPKKKTVRRDSTATKPRRQSVKARIVEKVLLQFEKQMEDEEQKVSVADIVRLMQIQSEAEEEELREIRVTWVEPSETESVIKS